MTRRAISPRFAMRIERRGSGFSEDGGVAVVFHRLCLAREALAGRSTRMRESEDMVPPTCWCVWKSGKRGSLITMHVVSRSA